MRISPISLSLIASMLTIAGAASPVAVSHAQPATKQQDVTTIPQLRERAVNYLFETADLASTDPRQNELRANAIEALLPVPARLEPLLKKAMRDPSLGIRTVAVMAAGKGKMRNLADNVRPLLDDSSNLVKASAIFAMSRIGSPANPTPLADLLSNPEPIVRAHAAYVLGELGNKSAVPMLLEAAGAPVGRSDPSKDRLMRLQIAEALVKLGKNDAIDEIRAALYPGRPEDLEACALAVQLLGQLKDEGARSQLRNMTSEKYDSGGAMPAEIRLGAAMSLARMGERSFAWVADQYASCSTPALRSQAAAVYGELRDPDQLGKLAQMLTDPEATVRVSAAAAIVKITEGQ